MALFGKVAEIFWFVCKEGVNVATMVGDPEAGKSLPPGPELIKLEEVAAAGGDEGDFGVGFSHAE